MMRTTVHDLQGFKARGERFSMVTAYDYTSAQLVDRAGLPVILVGDSLGTVVQGQDTTIPVTLDEVIYHTRLVARGAREALVVADLPFMTYRDVPEALESGGRLIQEGRSQAVKLEGAGPRLAMVEALVENGIPVMGHLGFTPQSAHQFGRRIVRGKTAPQATEILADAQRLEQAGAFAVVLECVPIQLAAMVTDRLQIPTIGIGSGPQTDGQVQVWHDLLGLYTDFVPRHVKQYATLATTIADALTDYATEVRDGTFPQERHGTRLPDETVRELFRDVTVPRTA